MNETQDNQDASGERLRQLLRQWGADEAVRSAEVGPAPAAPAAPARAGVLHAVFRWAPLAAACVLVGVAAALFVASRAGPAPEAMRAGGEPTITDVLPPRPAAAPTATRPAAPEVEELTRQLAASRRRLGALADLPARLAELQDKLQREQTRHQADVRELTARAAAGKKAGDDLAEKLTAAEERIAGLERERGALQASAGALAKATGQIAGLQARLAAATEELARVRKLHEKAHAAQAARQRELDLLRVRQVAAYAMFQETFLAAHAPGEGGLKARQTAARSRRLLARFAELRPQVRGEEARRLLERLEVVLIRLDLLDPDRVGAQRALAQLLRRSDLPKQIDAALATEAESQPVQTWLLEARLILMGPWHVG